MPKHTSRVFGDGSRGECEALVAAARSLGEGRLEVRVNIAATSAFHPVAEALNAMAERVAAMVVGQRELAAAACHELRHPLMRLRFRHALVRGAAGREERDQNLDRMAEDLDLLDRIAAEFLACAQLDATEAEPRLRVFPVAPWLATLERHAREAARARGQDLELEFRVNAIEVRGEPETLARAAGNLIANAQRHAARKVRVSVEVDNGRSRIHVDDDGPGVPEGDRKRVFEVFRRGAPGSEAPTAGFGMGLAIVRRVARRHGGSASVSESPLGGARFTLSW
jgi:signal transduction histidine kinase